VNSLGDTGAGTGLTGDLRFCITQADATTGDNTINFSVTGTITLNSALPDLSNTTGLTDIEGPGAASLTVARSSGAGTPAFRIFTVDANVQAKIAGLTITGGLALNGGGIYNGGTLTVTNSIITNNSATGFFSFSGGGINNQGTMAVTNSIFDKNSGSNGGGIDNLGTMAINNSTFDNNSGSGIANFNGGTLAVTNSSFDNNSGGEGGGINNQGPLTVTNSTFDNNEGGEGGGVFNAASMTVTNSTFAYNVSEAGFDGIGEGGGGGISEYVFSTLIVTNSTFAHNSADHGGGINGGATVTNSTFAYNSARSGGGIAGGSGLTVTNSTFAYNAAGAGGGGGIGTESPLTVTNSTFAYNTVSNGGTGGGLDVSFGPATLNNTIVALNTNGTGVSATPSDIAGTVAAASAYNLIGTGGSGGLVNGVNGNQVGVANPGLGTLGSNGGPTQTIPLSTGSPAIDKGSNALAVDATGQPLVYDQRGPGFPRIVNGTVDIGAFEVQSAAATIIGSSVGWGSQIAPLQTAADFFRLLPAGRLTDIPWLGINRFQITLSTAETLTAGNFTVVGVSGTNYGPVSVSGSGTSYTITLAKPINVADRVWITVTGPGLASFIRRLDVLPGDFNDDGVVNIQDMVGVRNQILGLAPVTIFGDINGDGKVDINDYNAVRARIGTTLPPLT
jgi:hypothetical protein